MEYISANIPGGAEAKILVYEDEGFSGKNTKRPRFQQMMEDMRKNHFQYLVCYRLDRLGRNIADLALLIDKRVTFSELRDAAFAAERKLLRSVSLFDVYEGDKLPEGKKSYALSFVLEDKTRTLDERTIERVMANLTRQFEQKCGAQVRA